MKNFHFAEFYLIMFMRGQLNEWTYTIRQLPFMRLPQLDRRSQRRLLKTSALSPLN